MSLEPPSCPCPGLLGGASGAQGTWSPHTQHVQQLGVGAARPSLPVPPPLEKSYQRSACGRGWGTCHGSRAAMSGKSRDGTHWKIAQPVKDVPWVQVPRWGSQRPDAADASCTAARPGPARHPEPSALCSHGRTSSVETGHAHQTQHLPSPPACHHPLWPQLITLTWTWWQQTEVLGHTHHLH